MLNDLQYIATFVVEGFLNLWIYLLISIPLAVTIRVSNAQQYIQRIFTGHPAKMILLATAVGAFSPFCACTVVPVIASLLIAGVPLAPVMAFWIASPSMDPEIFFLSAGLLGWELAVARVVATLVLSLTAGFATQWLVRHDFFAAGILREKRGSLSWSWREVYRKTKAVFQPPQPIPAMAVSSRAFISLDSISSSSCGPSCSSCSPAERKEIDSSEAQLSPEKGMRQKIMEESLSVTWMVVKFMALAFVLEALILLYVPQETIVTTLGKDNPLAILLAALTGIPIYTTNLTALPLVSGLMEQGMTPGAALAFLIAGPTTTLPAMAAVFGIARRRVFLVYLASSLIGAIALGYAYQALITYL